MHVHFTNSNVEEIAPISEALGHTQTWNLGQQNLSCLLKSL